MQVIAHPDVAAFADRAVSLLVAREAANNLLLGLCAELRRNANLFGASPPVLRTVEDAGAVVLVALQTPPWPLALSWCEHPAAIAALARALGAERHDLPGVVGPVAVAEAFARRWAADTGVVAAPRRSQRIYQVTTVRRPAAASGAMRSAAASDRALLLRWIEAFHREALGEATPSGIDAEADRWLVADARRLYVWDDGAPASMAGVAGPTPNGIRVGAVYTPPERRRRGYASTLVAAVSQAQLDAGRRFCFLYTDLSNPTSNHIYQAIGYEPVIDSAELRFVAG